MSPSSHLPTPPIPADTNLSRYDGIAFSACALEQSPIYRQGTSAGGALVYVALMNLIKASWRQLPTGSLPNDDRELARMARLDKRQFARVRDQLLGEWPLHSDGRRYCAIVTPVVVMLRKNNQLRPLKATLTRLDAALSMQRTVPAAPTPHTNHPPDDAAEFEAIKATFVEAVRYSFGAGAVPHTFGSKDCEAVANWLNDGASIALIQRVIREQCARISGKSLGAPKTIWILDQDVRRAMSSEASSTAGSGARSGADVIDLDTRRQVESIPDNIWERRLSRLIAARGSFDCWMSNEYGPRPGQPGCRVPDHLLRKFADSLGLNAGAA